MTPKLTPKWFRNSHLERRGTDEAAAEGGGRGVTEEIAPKTLPRYRNIQTNRHTHTNTHVDTQTHRHADTQTQTPRRTYTHTQTSTQTDTHTNTQTLTNNTDML